MFIWVRAVVLLIAAILVIPTASSQAATPYTKSAAIEAKSKVVKKKPQKVVPISSKRHGLKVTPSKLNKPVADVDYSVSITRFDDKLKANEPSSVTGSSTGFSDWNWVNVWVRPAGSSSSKTWIDGGGNWVKSGSFKIPVAYPDKGEWELQLSLGAWPDEKYSQIVSVSVSKGRDDEPYVVEAGAAGHRYMRISGRTSMKPGSLVYLWVRPPGRASEQYVMYETVDGDGRYVFNHANAGTVLDKVGSYDIKVSSGPGGFPVIGYTTYINY